MKQELRKYYRQRRILNANYDNIFINKLLKLVDKFSNIALYLKIDYEVNLEMMINKLFLIKNIYLPVVKNRNLEFRKFTSFSELAFDDAKIKAPINGEKIDKHLLDVIIVPCIAANIKGYRLGYGGGYYDRTLQNYQGLTIGLVFDNCLTNIDFQDDFDIPLNILVTEKQILHIKGRNQNV